MNKYTTIRIPAARYEDYDDCLTAAANDVAEERGLQGWDLSPRWEDDERDTILIDVPEMTAETQDGRFMTVPEHRVRQILNEMKA